MEEALLRESLARLDTQLAAADRRRRESTSGAAAQKPQQPPPPAAKPGARIPSVAVAVPLKRPPMPRRKLRASGPVDPVLRQPIIADPADAARAMSLLNSRK